jgi:hypothetical protein
VEYLTNYFWVHVLPIFSNKLVFNATCLRHTFHSTIMHSWRYGSKLDHRNRIHDSRSTGIDLTCTNDPLKKSRVITRLKQQHRLRKADAYAHNAEFSNDHGEGIQSKYRRNRTLCLGSSLTSALGFLSIPANMLI